MLFWHGESKNYDRFGADFARDFDHISDKFAAQNGLRCVHFFQLLNRIVENSKKNRNHIEHHFYKLQRKFKNIFSSPIVM